MPQVFDPNALELLLRIHAQGTPGLEADWAMTVVGWHRRAQRQDLPVREKHTLSRRGCYNWRVHRGQCWLLSESI